MQWRMANDSLYPRNQLFYVEYRFDFSKSRQICGLVLECRDPLGLFLGFLQSLGFQPILGIRIIEWVWH